MGKQTWLTCTISLGQFSDEFAVDGKAHDNTGFSLFVPRDNVECDTLPTGGGEVKGRLRVTVLEESGNLVLVNLPASTLENGTSITVSREQLQPGVSKIAITMDDVSPYLQQEMNDFVSHPLIVRALLLPELYNEIQAMIAIRGEIYIAGHNVEIGALSEEEEEHTQEQILLYAANLHRLMNKILKINDKLRKKYDGTASEDD